MSQAIKFLRSASHFLVKDVIESAEFYRDKLGFQILGYFGQPAIFVMVSRGDVEIHMSFSKSEIIHKASDLQSLPCDVYIWVSDIEGLFEELNENKVAIVEGPVKRIYNCTEIIIKDCNGYYLVFGGITLYITTLKLLQMNYSNRRDFIKLSLGLVGLPSGRKFLPCFGKKSLVIVFNFGMSRLDLGENP